MDVDLLRPGTVPLSPDTTLWFEFLLDPSRLEKHLENPVGDPSPTELISKFISVSEGEKDGTPPELPPGLGFLPPPPQNYNRRGKCLKILAVKVAAHLKFDLDLFENKIPLYVQAIVLKDLLDAVSPDLVDIPGHQSLNLDELEPHALFAVFLYHRWVLKAFVSSTINGKPIKPNGVMSMNDMPCEEVNEAASENSLSILKKLSVTKMPRGMMMPKLGSFTVLSEYVADVVHKWDIGLPISFNQFRCQVLMDIASYLMLRESYKDAQVTLRECQFAFDLWKREPETEPYCTVTSDTISGYCIAVGITPHNFTPSLIQEFHNLVQDQYLSINRVVERDNIMKEIPLMYRDCLELDVTSEVANGKVTVYRDGLIQVQASNVVRRALEGGCWQGTRVTPSALHKALAAVIPRATEVERRRLKYLVGETLVNGDLPTCREMTDLPSTKALLTEDELSLAMEADYNDPIPHALSSSDMDVDSPAEPHRSPSLELAAVERVLTSSYDAHDLKQAVTKVMILDPTINMATLNKNWEIPIPINNLVLSLPAGFLQNYCFLLLAKAYELDQLKNFRQARAMMASVCDEINRAMMASLRDENSQVVAKANQFIMWEILLIDIHQFHAEWPDEKYMDIVSLSNRCVALMHKSEGCLPRFALKEECALTLLNTCHWAALIAAPVSKHSVLMLDLYPAIAAACDDIMHQKKISPEIWDKLIPMFAVNQKRRDSLPVVTAALCSIAEINAIAIVISLLARLHNIIIDQPQMELYAQNVHLWPNSIKTPSQYNLKSITEIIFEVLTMALSRYPNNVHWLKLLGDLHFVNGHHMPALRSYIEAIIAATDCFSRPLHKNLVEDHIYKRMIKCCSTLQCHTQAGILCQFLDEVDYTTAYKSLSEAGCSDAMDSYYDCIWDVNILEFLINLHTKRGEHHRKQKVIRIIGLLELNSNNNEEIKREAENLRKGRFMRAMAEQYLS
uniref:Integrator complex subunit 8 n=1 Tax=Lygus hesperus TaxID=30085 RepID=A0A0A9YL24_LYGHE